MNADDGFIKRRRGKDGSEPGGPSSLEGYSLFGFKRKCMYSFWQIFNDSQTKYKAKDERTSSALTTFTVTSTWQPRLCWPGRILVFLIVYDRVCRIVLCYSSTAQTWTGES